MRCLAPALAVVIATSVALQGSTVSATTCKHLTDDDSTFAGFLRDTLEVDEDLLKEILDAAGPLDDAVPWLSTCVASIDPMSVFSTAQLSSGYKACNASIMSYEMPEELNDDSVRNSLCPFYGQTLMPCINNVAVQVLLDAMAGAGTCCDGVKNQMKTWFGVDIKTMVSDLLNKFGAAVCTVKTFTNSAGATKSEACVTSLDKSFMTEDTSDYWFALIQMPTDQVCKAVTGQTFSTTLEDEYQFKWTSLVGETLGICYEPLSDLFKLIGSYPVMKTPMTAEAEEISVSMADAFTSGKCLLADDVYKWSLDNESWPMQWARAADDYIALFAANGLDLGGSWVSSSSGPTGASESLSGSSGSSDSDGSTGVADGSRNESEHVNFTAIAHQFMESLQENMPPMCLHLATGQKCDYGSATTSLTYKAADTTPTTTTPSPTTTTTTKTKSASSSLLAGVALATTTVATSVWLL